MKKCCICGKEIEDWGNNPWGALDENGDQIEWEDDDECCDDCNNTYVLSGRIANMYKTSKEDIKMIMPDRLVKRK